MTSENPVNNSIKIEQLSILNDRSRWYAGRLWQLPFVYVAIIAIALNDLDAAKNPSTTVDTHLFLAAIGCMVFWCMLGTSYAIHLTVKAIQKIEKELGLEIVTRTHLLSIEMPYYLITLAGIFASVFLLLFKC